MAPAPGNALVFLIETLFNLYLAALLLRILLEAVRADYYNPISQVLLKITQPLVAPVGRIVPRSGAFNTAAVIVLYLLQVLALTVTVLLSGFAPDLLQLAVGAVFRLIKLLLVMYLVLIIIGVILSWIGQSMRHPIIPLIHQLTAPVLAPFRRIIPPIAGLDLSPLFAIIAIQFLIILLGV